MGEEFQSTAFLWKLEKEAVREIVHLAARPELHTPCLLKQKAAVFLIWARKKLQEFSQGTLILGGL